MFVESDRRAAEAIERNLVTAGLHATVRVQDVFGFLGTATQHFDIIFADPPYEQTAAGEQFTDLLLRDKAIAKLLAVNGLFVLEKSPQERLPPHPQWGVLRARKYGATEVLFLAHAS